MQDLQNAFTGETKFNYLAKKFLNRFRSYIVNVRNTSVSIHYPMCAIDTSAFYSQVATAQTAAYWGRTPTTLSTQNKNSAHWPLRYRSGHLIQFVYWHLYMPTLLHRTPCSTLFGYVRGPLSFLQYYFSWANLKVRECMCAMDTYTHAGLCVCAVVCVCVQENMLK